uniref:Uncharacterized protein n=1 Tax=Anguilla anguilla TaxID=7936 RepID=A0A0E9XGU2_ANGAN
MIEINKTCLTFTMNAPNKDTLLAKIQREVCNTSLQDTSKKAIACKWQQ